MKRLPLRPSIKPLARRLGLKHRSEKRTLLYEQRRPFVERVLREHPNCERSGCTRQSSVVHEPLTRARGGSILDENNVKALCHPCHVWVHDHPKEAELLGLLVHSWHAPPCDDRFTTEAEAQSYADLMWQEYGQVWTTVPHLDHWHIR